MIHEEEDDLLLRATRAMREEQPAAPADPMVTLRRIQWSVAKEKRRSLRTRTFLLPIAATLATSTAFAAASGKLTPIIHAVAEAFHPTPTEPVAVPTPKAKPRSGHVAPSAEVKQAAAPSEPPADPPPAAPSAPQAPLAPSTRAGDALDAPPSALNAPPPERPTAAHSAMAPRANVHPHGSSAAPEPASGASLPMPPARSTLPAQAPRATAATNPMTEPASAPSANAAPAESAAPDRPRDPADDLYRRAHALHFGPQSPTSLAATLASWDDYLNASPNGRFAPEARFNRAIVLVKLGRRTEAAMALAPFADGTYGSYRRDEARALLDAITARR